MTDSTNHEMFLSARRKRSRLPVLSFMMDVQKAAGLSEDADMSIGNPNTDLLPLDGITFHIRGGKEIKLAEEEIIQFGRYGSSLGTNELLQQLRDLISHVFHPPGFAMEGHKHDVMASTGNTHAIHAVMLTLIDSGKDSLLVERVTCSSFVTKAQNYGAKVLQVDCDEEGYIPSSLRLTIENWHKKTGRHPKLLYVMPHAANPTGASMGEQRIRDIYKIASEYNVLILEDDPYYFVSLKQGQPFPPVFLTVDVDGRVIRLDSFSYILAPGLRLGCLAAGKTIIANLARCQDESTMYPCTISQLFVARYLQEEGLENFLRHAYSVSAIYDKRRELANTEANKWLTGLCEWKAPKTGMFLWLKVMGVKDTLTFCEDLLRKHEVLFTPGADFSNQSSSPNIRVCFSRVSEETIKRGFRILGETLHEMKQD